MYETIDDLPFVCRLNLPEAALRVYRDSFNRAWRKAGEAARFQLAQSEAWSAVRRRFERDRVTGRWVPRKRSASARKRSAQ